MEIIRRLESSLLHGLNVPKPYSALSQQLADNNHPIFYNMFLSNRKVSKDQDIITQIFTRCTSEGSPQTSLELVGVEFRDAQPDEIYVACDSFVRTNEGMSNIVTLLEGFQFGEVKGRFAQCQDMMTGRLMLIALVYPNVLLTGYKRQGYKYVRVDTERVVTKYFARVINYKPVYIPYISILMALMIVLLLCYVYYSMFRERTLYEEYIYRLQRHFNRFCYNYVQGWFLPYLEYNEELLKEFAFPFVFKWYRTPQVEIITGYEPPFKILMVILFLVSTIIPIFQSETHSNDNVAVVLDLSIVEYLVSERVNTFSELETAKKRRLVMAIAQKQFSASIPLEIIRDSVDTFLDLVLKEDFDFSMYAIEAERYSDFKTLTVKEGIVILPEQVLFAEPFIEPLSVEYNGLVTYKRGNGITFQGGYLEFDEPFESQRESIYIKGPHPASAAVYYEVKSTSNIRAAFTRLTGSLPGDKPYRMNQSKLIYEVINGAKLDIQNARFTKAFRDTRPWGLSRSMCRRYNNDAHHKHFYSDVSEMFDMYCNTLRGAYENENLIRVLSQTRFEQTELYAHEEHLKQEERLMGFNNMLSTPSLFDGKLDYVTAKVKWEMAKYKKITRQFVSLGVNATLLYPEFSRLMKDIFATRVSMESLYGTVHVQFVKEATSSNMDAFANNIGNAISNRDAYLYFHSDDSHLSQIVCIDGKPYRLFLDMDISKCDLSHGPELFMLLFKLGESFGFDVNMMTLLFKQLQTPIKVQHPSNKEHFAMFEVEWMLLMSGSTLTTIVNNLATLLILFSVYRAVGEREFKSPDEVKDVIVCAAAEVGYLVTLDNFILTPLDTKVNDLEYQQQLTQITFLKHFIVPALDAGDGQFIAVKCLSTLIRSTGIYDNPSLDGYEQLQNVFKGYKNSHNCEFILSLYDKLFIEKDDQDVRHFDSFFLAARYKVDLAVLESGFDMLLTSKTPSLVFHPGLFAVLDKGYGLIQI